MGERRLWEKPTWCINWRWLIIFFNILQRKLCKSCYAKNHCLFKCSQQHLPSLFHLISHNYTHLCKKNKINIYMSRYRFASKGLIPTYWLYTVKHINQRKKGTLKAIPSPIMFQTIMSLWCIYNTWLRHGTNK